jgi:hypothetical protein
VHATSRIRGFRTRSLSSGLVEFFDGRAPSIVVDDGSDLLLRVDRQDSEEQPFHGRPANRWVRLADVDDIEREGLCNRIIEIRWTFDDDRRGGEADLCEAGVANRPALVSSRCAATFARKRNLSLEKSLQAPDTLLEGKPLLGKIFSGADFAVMIYGDHGGVALSPSIG